jgi:hypothetical protein
MNLVELLNKAVAEGAGVKKAINKKGEQFGVNVTNVTASPTVMSYIGRSVDHNGVKMYVGNIDHHYQSLCIARPTTESVEDAVAGL